MPLAAGQVLQNRYRIVSLLGQGGMGAVYRVWHLGLEKPVALKEMIPQPGLDAATLQRFRTQFRQEAIILGRLSHPNLVPVTDYFEENGNDYLVMAFVEGENLADRIERDGALPEDQVVVWARELLDALAYCHEHGVIHRDIKPQNVIITPEGQAVLVDFGLVKLWDPANPLTMTVMRGVGTPEYAPPEQWGTQGQHTDPRTDLYSLGATLYHALTGQAPPTASDRMVYPKQFRTPRELNGIVSPNVDLAVTLAMTLAIDERWPDARTMSKNLLSPVWDASANSVSPPGRTQRLPDSQRTAIEPTPFEIYIRVENRSPDEICNVFISPSDKASWGADQLGDSEVIGSGSARVFIVPAGSYDIRVETWNQVVMAAAADVTGDTAIGVGDRAANVRLLVDNRSPWEICSVYIVPVGSSDWGADWMDTNESLLPNGKRMFYLKPGTYDLCAANCDGEVSAEEYGIGVTEDVTWTLGN